MPSSVIESVRYDADANTLDVVFTTGRVYRYFAVPAHVHQELRAAESMGRYFNEVIRPRYPYEELT